MSQALGIPCSNYDASDVEELIKRKKFESRRPQQHLESRQGNQLASVHEPSMRHVSSKLTVVLNLV